MFYLSVELEKGQIVDRSLDPKNEAELVVQLDGNRPHGVFDSRAELAAEKGGDVVRLQGMNRRIRTDPGSRVSGGEVPLDRAALGELVEPRVDSFCFPCVGDGLRTLPVRNVAESVVGQLCPLK